MIQSGSSYPALCKIVLPKLSCMSSSLLFQSTRYVMLHDGKSLMPFVSGDILKPKKKLGPIPPSKKLFGTYSIPTSH